MKGEGSCRKGDRMKGEGSCRRGDRRKGEGSCRRGDRMKAKVDVFGIELYTCKNVFITQPYCTSIIAVQSKMEEGKSRKIVGMMTVGRR